MPAPPSRMAVHLDPKRTSAGSRGSWELDPSWTLCSNIIATNSEIVGSKSHSLRQSYLNQNSPLAGERPSAIGIGAPFSMKVAVKPVPAPPPFKSTLGGAPNSSIVSGSGVWLLRTLSFTSGASFTARGADRRRHRAAGNVEVVLDDPGDRARQIGAAIGRIVAR